MIYVDSGTATSLLPRMLLKGRGWRARAPLAPSKPPASNSEISDPPRFDERQHLLLSLGGPPRHSTALHGADHEEDRAVSAPGRQPWRLQLTTRSANSRGGVHSSPTPLGRARTGREKGFGRLRRLRSRGRSHSRTNFRNEKFTLLKADPSQKSLKGYPLFLGSSRSV